MLEINHKIKIPDWEMQMTATTSQGPGGQNVNKVATAIQLRFDIQHSSLPFYLKNRLLKSNDHRLLQDGVWLVKAQNHRSQEANKLEALSRLKQFILKGLEVPKHRQITRPPKSAERKRVQSKKARGEVKKNRSKVDWRKDS